MASLSSMKAPSRLDPCDASDPRIGHLARIRLPQLQVVPPTVSQSRDGWDLRRPGSIATSYRLQHDCSAPSPALRIDHGHAPVSGEFTLVSRGRRSPSRKLLWQVHRRSDEPFGVAGEPVSYSLYIGPAVTNEASVSAEVKIVDVTNLVETGEITIIN